MSSRIGIPMTLRLRLAGSGLLWSVPGGPLVQAILPHSTSPHGATRTTAILFATSQSPTGSAAKAGPLRPRTAMIEIQDFAILSSFPPAFLVGCGEVMGRPA